MVAISLQSGSNGNCIYVEAGGVRLLFDAGISGLKAERRLAEFGRDIRRVDGVVLSHDHADHVCGAGVLQRKFGLAVHVTAPTLRAAAEGRRRLGDMEGARLFASGDTLDFGAVTVETLRTPHDGADGVAFVVCCRGKRLGILTDLGHVFPGLPETVAALDAVFLESNYDPRLLAEGPYPAHLKRRIRGPGGHLSNAESAQLLAGSATERLQWAALAHLSEVNNCPETALAAHTAVAGDRYRLVVAGRYAASGPFAV